MVEDFIGMLAATRRGEGDNQERLKPGPARLKELAESYLDGHAFQPGDLAMWKPGLKNALFPDYGEPVVVLEANPGARDEEENAAKSSFREPRDIRIGVYPNKNDLEGFWLDSHRFEPYQEAPVAEETQALVTESA